MLGSAGSAPQRLCALSQHRRALGRRAARPPQPLRLCVGVGGCVEDGHKERGGGAAGRFAAEKGESVDACRVSGAWRRGGKVGASAVDGCGRKVEGQRLTPIPRLSRPPSAAGRAGGAWLS